MNSKTLINKLLLLVFGIFIYSGCTDLEVDERDSIVIDGAGGGFTAGNPTELLSAAYSDLGALANQTNVYSLYTHTSDEMIPPTRGVDWSDNGVWRTLHAHTWDPTHAYVLGAWNELNERAFKANQILASNPSTQEAAEAKFLRAFYTYQVMDLFGQVPFRAVDEGVDVDPRVFTRQEAFDFVVQDLNEALPDLPDLGPSSTNPRASKAAANALLARLYLNKAVYTAANAGEPAGFVFEQADMTRVVQAADAVTASGYALEDDYFTNFTTDASSEIIFTSPGGSGENRWQMTLHYSQNPSGWNGFTTIAEFYDKFEANDQRIGKGPGTTDYVFDSNDFPADVEDDDDDGDTSEGKPFNGIGRGFLVGQQYNDDGTEAVDSRTTRLLQFTRDVPLSGAATDKGIRAIKYHPRTSGQYILLRYADVVLMKAEAIMRGGTSGETALDVVNQLRSVRGASLLTSLDETTMLDERGRELYWEGNRRTDQIRFGTFTDTWSEKTIQEPFRTLFPIPQQAIDSNPNLVQNPGY